MPRNSPNVIRMHIELDRTSAVTLDRQIAQGIREAIASGLLRPGDHLTAIRQLAEQLGVSRSTIDAAYAALINEGYLKATRGRGTFVSTEPPIASLFAGTEMALPTRFRKKSVGEAADVCRMALESLQAQKNIPLAIVGTASEVSPVRDFTTFLQRQFKKNLLEQVYSHPAGSPRLREAVCKIASRLRGVRAKPHQVIITSGSQLGLEMTHKALFNAGDKVWYENPGYPLLHAAGLFSGVKPVYVPIDDNGLDFEAGLKLFPNPKGVYLTPSHQCPLGVMMGLARRRRILNWAAENGVWIIEDDYDSELRYDGNLPYPSLQGMDTTASVVYVGTFSKMLFPGLRLGYIIAPESLVDIFTGMRLLIDRQGNELLQNAVAEYIEEGLYEAHVRRMRHTFETRRNDLIRVCRREFGEWGAFTSGDQGMSVTFEFFDQTIDDIAVWRECLAQGVESRAISSFYAPATDPSLKRRGLVLGFGFFTHEQILAAASSIGFVLRSRFAAFARA